jgi:phosphoribosylanthranilate isomerase
VEDALEAVAAGADAIGMVFWSGSKRAMDPIAAQPIAESIPPSVGIVGVFVDASAEFVCKTSDMTGITVAQLCGDIGPGDWTKIPRALRVVRALPIAGSEDPDSMLRMIGVSDYLLDNGSDGSHGGTGETFDWSLVDRYRSWGRIWLAGGLNPDNVARAISIVRPHAVDVSSGVESAPGIKSPELIRGFIDAVHHADHAIAKAEKNAH